MRSITLRGRDDATGVEFGGVLHAVETEPEKPKGIEPVDWCFHVEHFFPADKSFELMTGKRDASPYIQAAIDGSWDWVVDQYKDWNPEPGVNYPAFQGSKTAWGASSAAVGIPVVLPPGTLRVEQDLELPQCVPLLGTAGGSLFGGSKLLLADSSTLGVVGNVITNHGPFQMITGGVSGVKFVRNEETPLWLMGNLSNFRITDCHFSGVGHRTTPMIDHVNSYEMQTRFGEIITTKNSGHTLKEVTIEGCQFEGGSSAIDLTGGLNVNIHNNTILYSHVGMVLRNCKKVRITCNNVLGTKPGEQIQVNGQAGIVAGGSDITAQSNQFRDLDLGIAVNHGKSSPSSNNVFANDWQRVKEGYNGTRARVGASWKFPRDFGTFKKGTRAPFAG